MSAGGAVQRFWRSHPIHLAAVSSSVADECPVGWLFVHEGGAPGANTAFVVLPSNGYVVVGLSNTDPDAMENVVNYIARRLPL
ncbi:serine hydrolase [Xanthomonas hortorum pv. pelargonii]|nr:serine hydrolase [Xanthomonas hortorum]MCM5525594.1 serine hydrolase [Xanthomonas hortorum pv. pelargonii]MCM5536815.1 serine hydrolase [Xanthomonas hortorum pv. pelargonii]MCM5541611.1 serine hydrolase [Xanthomonas hortorum pv. pelargonii]MCM5563828.1 serine hydrolase [Xanthomonas hortorum pv. pelargonii]MCM5626541.1 serine hydrolase [Xanthomonas hortorum pv. pelargonii]